MKKGVLVIPDMYLNAGGVTVSYFEWLKNLSHVRYGRMEKRFTENLNTHILSQLEELTGKNVRANEREFIMHGAEEVDLVYSGLEETMITATHEIMDCWKSNPSIPDMRTAAYVVAINKVGTCYAELGYSLKSPRYCLKFKALHSGRDLDFKYFNSQKILSLIT